MRIICLELLTTPPGFAAGLFFEPDNVTVSENDTSGAQKKGVLENNVINLMDVVKEEQKVFGSYFLLCSKYSWERFYFN